MFLGGHEVSEESKYRSMLLDFWTKFRAVNPGFDFFARDDYNAEMASLSIPCLVHGDDGGKAKRPIMILAIQPHKLEGAIESQLERVSVQIISILAMC